MDGIDVLTEEARQNRSLQGRVTGLDVGASAPKRLVPLEMLIPAACR